MSEHKTVLVSGGNQTAQIDEMIAPLIEAIWKHGIHTDNSCQDNVPKGWVWVCFVTPSDAELFLDLAAGEHDYEINSLYNRICRGWEPEDQKDTDKIDWWRFDVEPIDCSIQFKLDDDGDMIETAGPDREFGFMLSVRFPQSDLDTVTKRLQEKL